MLDINFDPDKAHSQTSYLFCYNGIFVHTHELQESRQVNIKQIRSSNNLTNIFTKSLSTSTFEKLVYDIGMRRVSKLQD